MALTEKVRKNLENVINQMISDYKTGKRKTFVLTMQNLGSEKKVGDDKKRDFWLLFGERLRESKLTMKNFSFDQENNVARFSLEPQKEQVSQGAPTPTPQRTKKKPDEGQSLHSPSENKSGTGASTQQPAGQGQGGSGRTKTTSENNKSTPNTPTNSQNRRRQRTNHFEEERQPGNSQSDRERGSSSREDKEDRSERIVYVPGSYAEPQTEHKVTNARSLKPREVNPYFSAVM